MRLITVFVLRGMLLFATRVLIAVPPARESAVQARKARLSPRRPEGRFTRPGRLKSMIPPQFTSSQAPSGWRQAVP